MKKLNYAMFFVAVLFSVTSFFAQDTSSDTHTITISVPEVAIVDVEPSASKNLTLGFTAPDEAGDPLTNPDDDTSLWLNYSSIKSAADPTRTVSVKINALLAGVDIKVTAAADAGNGDGTVGTPGSTLTLSASDQTLISGIGSCYTADGENNGHNLTYSVEAGTSVAADYADLLANAVGSAVTVTYTISDN